jgi:hypothetical protein
MGGGKERVNPIVSGEGREPAGRRLGTDELSRASGEGIGHNLYLNPETGQLVEGPEPTGEDLNFG